MTRNHYISMYFSTVGFWAAVCLGWAITFQHSLTFDFLLGLQQASVHLSGNDYLPVKVAVGIIAVGLATRLVKLKHSQAINRLTLFFGFCSLLLPLALILSTMKTDSKFLQLMVPLIGMTIPVVLAALITDILLPKSQSK